MSFLSLALSLVLSPSAQAMIGGYAPEANDVILKSTVKVIAKVGDKNQGIHCTGIIVTENAIITSAHCVYVKRRLDLILASPSARKRYSVKDVVIHPSYLALNADFSTSFSNEKGLQVAAVDIAVIVINEKFPDEMVQNYVNHPGDFSKEKTLEVAGYGTGLELNIGQMKINSSAAGSFTMYDDGAGLPSNGDAGGPAYVERNGLPYVYGMHFASVSSSMNGTSYFTRILPHIDWINKSIKEAND